MTSVYAPPPSGSGIALLPLSARSAGGKDTMAGVTRVQRLHTEGGNAADHVFFGITSP